MLRARIAAARRGEGGFSIVENGAEVPPGAAESAPEIASVPEGAVVLWRLENRAPALWALLDALDRGIVPVLLSATTPPGKLRALHARFPGFGVFDGRILDCPEDVARAPDVDLGVLTSGSTGDPKLVVTSAARLEAGVRAIHAAQGLEDVRATGVLLAIGYSYAFVNQVLWAVLHERRLVLTPGLLTPADTLAQLRAAHVDMLCMVATQLRTLLGLDFGAEEALPEVRVLNFAGAPFPVAEFAGLRTLFPNARALNNYGCTEAMPRISVCEVVSADHPVTDVGRPIGDLEVRVREADGGIEFRGGSAAAGTLDGQGSLQPMGEWIPSGDVGRLDGGRLHVLGRGDQVVKVGGERFSLLEVERALAEIGFEQTLAWLERDADGEWITAVVRGEGPTPRELKGGLRRNLPRVAWPRTIHRVEHWFLAPNGKTDRRRLIDATREGAAEAIWPPPPPAI